MRFVVSMRPNKAILLCTHIFVCVSVYIYIYKNVKSDYLKETATGLQED